jgi:hypothetical protein
MMASLARAAESVAGSPAGVRAIISYDGSLVPVNASPA